MITLTHGYFLADDAREQQIMRPYPPLGILYIASYLESKKIPVSVFDTTFSTQEKLKAYLIDNKPSVLAFYVNLMTKLNILGLIDFVKEKLPHTVIVLGGPEVTHSVESFLRHGAHYIVIGEGEQTMFDLCRLPVEHLHLFQGLESISGIAYIKGNQVVQNLEREKIKDLDLLPLPAREKIDISLYLNAWKNFHGKHAVSVSTMRGCPYTCKWCSRAVYGLSYRRRSPRLVAEEVLHIKKTYNPDSLWFVDDVFTISHRWLREFKEALQEHRVQIPYECITRADRMNQEVVALLKDTGCFRVWIGAESGSQKIIDLMDRRVEVAQVRNMIQLAREYKIEAGTFIMLGYPGETEQDIEDTISHLKACNPDHFTITLTYPIKGTDLYEETTSIQTPIDWKTSTDRQIDFKRTYPRQYYSHAIKRVTNETNFYKEWKHGRIHRAIRYKLRSILSKVMMRYVRALA